MKKLLILALLIINLFMSNSYSGEIYTTYNFSGKFGIIQNIISYGTDKIYVGLDDSKHIFVARVDSNNNIVWMNSYSYQSRLASPAFSRLIESTLLIFGLCNTYAGNRTLCEFKLNAINGHIYESKAYDNDYIVYLNMASFLTLNDITYGIAAAVDTSISDYVPVFITIDQYGNISLKKETTRIISGPRILKQRPNGNFLSLNYYYPIFEEYDSNGNIIRTTKFDISSVLNTSVSTRLSYSNEHVYLAFWPVSFPLSDFYFAKYDLINNRFLWLKRINYPLGKTIVNSGPRISADSEGIYLMITGFTDIDIYRLDLDGNLLWKKRWIVPDSNATNVVLYNYSEDINNNLILHLAISSTETYSAILKIQPNGIFTDCTEWSDITDSNIFDSDPTLITTTITNEAANSIPITMTSFISDVDEYADISFSYTENSCGLNSLDCSPYSYTFYNPGEKTKINCTTNALIQSIELNDLNFKIISDNCTNSSENCSVSVEADPLNLKEAEANLTINGGQLVKIGLKFLPNKDNTTSPVICPISDNETIERSPNKAFLILKQIGKCR